MNASVHTVDSQVRDYVAQVRAALSDLPVEDIDEFTTGMEADLSERLAEPGEESLRDRLGDPDLYAAELRAAAGLPPRPVMAVASKPAGQRLSDWWSGVSGSVLTAMPWLSDLRPLWWALRGFALAAMVMAVVGGGVIVLGALGALVSIAAGLMARRGVLKGAWVGPVRVVLNLAAILLLPFALAFLVSGTAAGSNDVVSGEAYPGYDAPGVVNNGELVANLYAYDETGRRIENVRLFDQNGRPVKLGEEALTVGPLDSDGAIDPDTGEVLADLSVFPLQWPGHDAWSQFYEWTPPLAITPLPGPVPSVEVSPSPSPSVSTSASPSATPSASPTPSGQATPTSPGSGAAATPSPTSTSR